MSQLPERAIDAPAVEEGDLDRFVSESWPQTRLVSAGFLLALAVALLLPVVLSDPSAPIAVALCMPVAIGLIAARHLFSSRALRTRGRVTASVVLATLPPAVVAVGFVGLSGWVAGVQPSPATLGASAVAAVLVLCGAAAGRAVEVRYLLNARRIFLVASQGQRRDVEREIRRHGGLSLVGHATVEPGQLRPTHDLLAEEIARARPTMLVLSGEAARSEAVVSAAAQFHARGGRVRDLNGFYGHHFRKVPLSELTPSWFLFDVAEIHRPRLYLAFKRGLEIVLGVLAITVAAPFLLLAALAIKLEDRRGPVLFRQQRIGKGGQPFTMLKLRTMRTARSEADARWAGADQDRITRAGRVLRRWRLDELPQLINVIFGQLSLVGPRPEQVAIVERLESQVEFYSARHRVRPGLTGWAQVNHGYGGSERGTLEKLQFDFYYVRNQSLRLDLLVITMTLRAVLRGDAG